MNKFGTGWFTLLLLMPGLSVAQGTLEYEFSFGQRLVVVEQNQRVTLEVTNASAAPVACEVASLLDAGSDDPVVARFGFQAVSGQDGCIGGSCLAIISPPPNIVLFIPVGPFESGETKTCTFEFVVRRPFSSPAFLVGSAGSIEVTDARGWPIPGMTPFPTLILVLAVLAIASLAFRASRVRGVRT